MLILGRKYKFTQLELSRLSKKFKNITIVKYTDRKQEDVLFEIEQNVNSHEFDVLVLNTKAKIPNEIVRYLTILQLKHNIEIITIEHFLERYLNKCYIPDSHDDLHFLEDIKPYSKWQYIQKRTIDIITALGIITLSLPMLVYSIYRIRKESPGNILYRQDRVGKSGKEFECTKFRSMIPDAEKNGAQFASINDPRVFRYGEIMRKMRIDEIPQIINVFNGGMHMIGPRPERRYWIEQFEKEIPYYSERHIVRPGITGWAQVMYPYGANAEDAKQKLMYDLYYIKYWSITLEIKTIWKTVMAMIGKKGL